VNDSCLVEASLPTAPGISRTNAVHDHGSAQLAATEGRSPRSESSRSARCSLTPLVHALVTSADQDDPLERRQFLRECLIEAPALAESRIKLFVFADPATRSSTRRHVQLLNTFKRSVPASGPCLRRRQMVRSSTLRLLCQRANSRRSWTLDLDEPGFPGPARIPFNPAARERSREKS